MSLMVTVAQVFCSRAGLIKGRQIKLLHPWSISPPMIIKIASCHERLKETATTTNAKDSNMEKHVARLARWSCSGVIFISSERLDERTEVRRSLNVFVGVVLFDLVVQTFR